MANRAKNLSAHAAGADREARIFLALDIPQRLDCGAVDMVFVIHGRLLSVAGWPVEHLSAPITHKGWHFSRDRICMAHGAILPKIVANLKMRQRNPLAYRGTSGRFIEDVSLC
jgi:hypothetical protein